MTNNNSTIRELNKLTDDYGLDVDALDLIIKPHARLRAAVMAELERYFIKAELTALVDSQNGVLLKGDFIYNKSFFIAQLEDFQLLDGGISSKGADATTLLNKVGELSHAQVYFLLIDISAFWNNPIDLNRYLDQYAS